MFELDKTFLDYIICSNLDGVKSRIERNSKNIHTIRLYLDTALSYRNLEIVKIILDKVDEIHMRDAIYHTKAYAPCVLVDDDMIKLCEMCPQLIPHSKEFCEYYKRRFKLYTYYLSKLNKG